MKSILNKMLLASAISFSMIATSSCEKEEDSNTSTPTNTSKTMYAQEDQMGRPAINTVFVSPNQKDNFNLTIPSEQGAMFQSSFEARLLALNPAYSTNLLGLDASTFTTVLATDVLTVSLDGTTTFYDGTNVLTGRALGDDVVDVEFILVFGGPTASDNPGLTSDNVGQNDKAFLSTFPYLAAPF
tara:strand:- start:358 stop:912 length:555 start_codon:yes stop_codon:yes gene_type:complete